MTYNVSPSEVLLCVRVPSAAYNACAIVVVPSLMLRMRSVSVHVICRCGVPSSRVIVATFPSPSYPRVLVTKVVGCSSSMVLGACGDAPSVVVLSKCGVRL